MATKKRATKPTAEKFWSIDTYLCNGGFSLPFNLWFISPADWTEDEVYDDLTEQKEMDEIEVYPIDKLPSHLDDSDREWLVLRPSPSLTVHSRTKTAVFQHSDGRKTKLKIA